ncbi:CLI_3235 family bacteriocin precursor [Halodesulfovibrio spirochaetisodalis]
MKKLFKKNQKVNSTVSAYGSCYCSSCYCFVAYSRYRTTYSVRSSATYH